jgi:hypothetical protein
MHIGRTTLNKCGALSLVMPVQFVQLCKRIIAAFIALPAAFCATTPTRKTPSSKPMYRLSPILRAPLRRGGEPTRARDRYRRYSWHHLQRLRRSFGAGDESQTGRPWRAMVAVPPPVDRHVHHRELARFALLHRAVLAARLRELHARRCDPTEFAGNLARPSVSNIPARVAGG